MEKDANYPDKKSPSQTGTTASERYLAKLAQKAFLHFWSYPNPYTDENHGSELCDFMVVFGDDILLFSDKHCKFQDFEPTTINIAWKRWYKSAIYRSAKQLNGAASFIERYPNRIYLDSACKRSLPISLPSVDKQRIHLIAVTRGSAEAATKFYNTKGKNSSSSLILRTKINEFDNNNLPFMVDFWPLKNKRFIHILDELTLDILLNELDTASDFIKYLQKKEKYLSRDGFKFVICGEEDLLALYIMNNFSFPSCPDSNNVIVHDETPWITYSRSNKYNFLKNSNKISYIWDNLIEHQTSHIHKGTAPVMHKSNHYPSDINAHENMLRAMAEENRSARTHLARQFNDILNRDLTKDRLTKTIVLPNRRNRAYVLMILKRDKTMSEADYRNSRKESLIGYCKASRLRIKGITEIVGIASDQHDFSETSQDFTFMDFSECAPITQIEKEHEISLLRAHGIWKDHWECVI